TIGLAAARANLAALATLTLAASAPIPIQMTHEVRPYPVMILVYGLAILALLLTARRVADGGPLMSHAFVGYLAATALMLWLHSLGPLYGLALGLAALLLVVRGSLTRTDWLWLIGGHLLVGLIYLPALLILLDQAPTWIQSTWLGFETRDLWRRATAIYSGPRDDMRVAALVLAIGAFAAGARSPLGRRVAVALLLLAIVPVLCSILISATITPVFIVRTMTPLAVPAAILFGVGAVGLAGWGQRIMLAALIWMLIQQAAGAIATTRIRPMQDWYAALDWLAPRFRPGDIVYAYPNEGALPFGRAVFDRGLAMPSRAIPTEIPSLNPPPGSWYVSGSRGVPSLDPAHLHAIAVEPRTRAVPTIWLLRLGPWAYDKGDVLLKELSAERIEVGRYRDGPIDIVGLRAKP
ncbi:MAG: rane-like protein, partial [Rhizorhabdus sp.]|nr:rane-like protein [Rhizorhabdus sp.]